MPSAATIHVTVGELIPLSPFWSSDFRTSGPLHFRHQPVGSAFQQPLSSVFIATGCSAPAFQQGCVPWYFPYQRFVLLLFLSRFVVAAIPLQKLTVLLFELFVLLKLLVLLLVGLPFLHKLVARFFNILSIL